MIHSFAGSALSPRLQRLFGLIAGMFGMDLPLKRSQNVKIIIETRDGQSVTCEMISDAGSSRSRSGFVPAMPLTYTNATLAAGVATVAVANAAGDQLTARVVTPAGTPGDVYKVERVDNANVKVTSYRRTPYGALEVVETGDTSVVEVVNLKKLGAVLFRAGWGTLRRIALEGFSFREDKNPWTRYVSQHPRRTSTMTLAFFGNAATSSPFQRSVGPAQLGSFLNLEQSELSRIQRYNEAWRFYLGKQWNFQREDGDPLVTVNYFRKIIDKITCFMAGKGFVSRVPESLEEITLPHIDEVWKYNNKEQIAMDAALMGGVTGDVYFLLTYEEPKPMQRQINPYSQGRIRIQLLGSEQVFPIWNPLNMDELLAVRIETVFYSERGVPGVNMGQREIQTKRFTQIITETQIVEQVHGEPPIIRPNMLGEIPLVHVKNMSLPREYYGLPDGQDLIELQREYNEKSTDISDIINYHASPVTIIYGAKAGQLQKGPKQIWSGLPANAKVEALGLTADLSASQQYLDRVKKSIHELGDVPENALGAQRAISNTSGVALHMEYQPLLEHVGRKRIQFEPGFEKINYFILRIGVVTGLIHLPFDLCRSCGGRIIEVEVPNQTRKVWNVQLQIYEDRPLTRKRCYHINKETLDFEDPERMRLKFWRQYGFGSEIREAPLSQIQRELEMDRPSFWDYSVLLKKVQEKYRKDNPLPPPPPPQVDENGNEVPPPPPLPPDPNGPHEEDDQGGLPKRLQIKELPDDEIEIPEEPEEVEVTTRWLHPQTQELLIVETKVRSLVPTGCTRPHYLNPYETTVDFQDPLPKDEALQATLFEQYQRNGWVDVEWCQERIPAIAKDKTNINRRIKRNPPPPVPAGGQPTSGGRQANVMGADAGPRNLNKVPGPRGNPTKMGQ